MSLLRLQFGFAGRIGKVPFAIGAIAAAIVFQLGIQASLAALPWLAQVLAPRGINAGLALNAIWLGLGVLLVWSMTALGAKRLRSTGYSPWWAAAAVLPLAVLALINDAIFLVSRTIVLPAAVQWLILGISGAIALWVLFVGLIASTPDDRG